MIIKPLFQEVNTVDVKDLDKFFDGRKLTPPRPSKKRLKEWVMEDDDGPIFEYVYQVLQPRRHLEFGTWRGWGTALCLDSCDATVWTLNLPGGEFKSDGSWAYGERVVENNNALHGIVKINHGEDEQGPITYHQTDAGSYIGMYYREKGLGHRVCQILCDSREWDISNYPSDFFDSVLIDGGHQPDVVVSDTTKALQVLRPGGLIMWHDFCPLQEIRTNFESVAGVCDGIEQILPELRLQMETISWVNPSWILMGIKNK